MAAGFLDEVAALAARPGGLSRTASQALGYRELLAHLRGDIGLDDAIALAITRTRQFAVRQERWFRRDPRITWLDETDLANQVESVLSHPGRLGSMHLSKHHGLGNDFLVLLPDDVVPMPDDVAAALARRLCHRTRGIGADGLIIGGAPVRRDRL